MRRTALAFLLLLVVLLPSRGLCGDLYYSREGYLIAVTEEAFDICFAMGLDGDDAAFQQMRNAGLCVISRAGFSFYVVAWHMEKIEFRMEGDTMVFWGMRSMIDE